MSRADERGTLLLTRGEVASLLGLDAAIEAVESAFRLHAEGRTLPPGVLAVPAPGAASTSRARKPGRRDREEITVFDSTGTALQDAAAAAVVYERALAAGLGRRLDFAG